MGTFKKKLTECQMESGKLLPPTLFTLKGFLVLDSHGRRVLAHYYDPECLETTQSQNAFERKLFRKTAKTNVEVLIQDNLPIYTVVDVTLVLLGCVLDGK